MAVLFCLWITSFYAFFSKYRTDPKSANVLVCLQALEHFEKDDVHNVLEHLIGLTENFFFLDIDLTLAIKTLFDGRNAHTCIAPSDWFYAIDFSDKDQFPKISKNYALDLSPYQIILK